MFIGNSPSPKVTHLTKCPPLSEDLLQYLHQMFPDKCPHPKAEDRSIWLAVGAQEVVKHLTAVLSEQKTRKAT